MNLLGKVDVFQVTHHGTRDDVVPQQMWAMAPTVAVMNNGPAKGAGAVAVETVLRSPGLEDLWSLHRAVGNDAAHNAQEPLTANLGETAGCKGAWIRARVTDGGLVRPHEQPERPLEDVSRQVGSKYPEPLDFP